LSSTNNPKAKVARLTMLLLLLSCLLSLPLLAACSSSPIASVDAMNLQIGAGGYSIKVLLKPHNVSSDVYYQAELYEGNLLVGTQGVMWTGDDIAAQRDAVVVFPISELAPQVKEGTAKLTSTYHVTITPTTAPITTPTPTPGATTSVASGNVLVGGSYSGKQVELSVGQSLVVTLESNASTGYSWSLSQNSDDSVLNKTGNEYVAPQTTLVGASGREEWTFKALKVGTSMISMVYSRPWETDTPPAKTFGLTVVVQPTTPTPTFGGTALDVDLHSVKTAVDAYVLQAGEWPTANGSLPPTGQYAMIDFNASFDKEGKIFSFYPHFISNLPRHWDEGVWRIDSAALVSVDIASDKY
jgi:inhibitor of cysteine peptidase